MSNPNPACSILLVEDDADVRGSLEDVLSERGYNVTSVGSGREAVEACTAGQFDIGVLDVMLPDGSGLDRVPKMETLQPGIEILIITGHANTDLRKVVRPSTVGFFIKPVQVEQFLSAIERIAERQALARQNRDLQAAVHESEAELRNLMESNPDGLSVTVDGKIVYCNQALAKMSGYKPEELVGTSPLDHLPPRDRERAATRLREIALDGASRLAEYTMIHKNGKEAPAEIFSARIHFAGKAGIVSTVRDITHRKRAEKALRESEERYRTVVQTATDGVITVCSGGNIISWNTAAENIFGYSAEQAIGAPWTSLLPERYREADQKALEQAVATEESELFKRTFEFIGLKKGHVEFPLEFSAAHWKTGGETFLTGFVRDITERKRLEREILEISERERRRIGQDLHDGLGQRLTGIAFLSKALAEKLAAESSPKAADALEIQKLVNATIEEAWNLAKGLHPAALVAGGLGIALQELASNTEQLFDVSCVLTADSAAPLPDEVTTQLYYIAQEAVTNAVRHGEAKNITLELQAAGDTTTLAVEDDGRGLPADQGGAQGMGLQIMRYRARMIDGSLDIRRRPDGGTGVICSFPTPPTEEGESNQQEFNSDP